MSTEFKLQSWESLKSGKFENEISDLGSLLLMSKDWKP
jgi:hypothetical protein